MIHDSNLTQDSTSTPFKDSSEAFLELLPWINQGAIELLDDKRQTAQLIALERSTSTVGRDSLRHPPGGHDDRANALALAVLVVAKAAQYDVGKIRIPIAKHKPTWRISSDSTGQAGKDFSNKGGVQSHPADFNPSWRPDWW